jgi:hypothetical protein
MKQLSHFAAGAALVLATLGSSNAIASPTCDLCNWVGDGLAGKKNTYVGSFNSATPIEDMVEFRRAGAAFTSLTTFSDVWLFELNPSGGIFQINSQFNFAPDGITGFQVQLQKVTTSSCGVVTDAAASFCSGGYTLGEVIATSSLPNDGGQVYVNNVSLLDAPAYYAWVVSGTRASVNGATSYNGFASIGAVPEPTSLALVGAALVAAAVGARRKRVA